MSYFDELSGAANSPSVQNRLLFELLCDDQRRIGLYADLRKKGPVFAFNSRAPGSQPAGEYQTAFLLTRGQDIQRALETFSNSPYKPIGSGTFLLALDNNGGGHEEKRDFLGSVLRPSGMASNEIDYVAAIACHHAMVAPSKNATFDLVSDVAEQAALRFVGAFFGVPDGGHFELQETMRKVYPAMIYQMFARHFVTEPQVLADGNGAMSLLARSIMGLMRDLDSVPLAAKVAHIVTDHSAAAMELFTQIAAAAREVAPLRRHAVKYLEDMQADGLALRTAVFLDRIFDYAALRTSVMTKIAGCADIHQSLRDALLQQLQQLVARKQTSEEQLVPRTFASEGDPPRLVLNAQPEPPQNPYRRQSVLDRMVRTPNAPSSGEIAVAMVGSIAGIIGNVIASTCIALERYFELTDEERRKITNRLHPRAGLTAAGIEERIEDAKTLIPFITKTLTHNPPPPFVPRMTPGAQTFVVDGREITVPDKSEIVVPIGAATNDPGFSGRVDFFGSPGSERSSHRCLGDHIAMPLIAHVVRNVLVLPGLAQIVVNGEARGLRKKWGFICESFPLQYDSSSVRRQAPLNVVMKIRSPTVEHAVALKVLLKVAVPSIEAVLLKSQIVHFARFVFLNNDTELGLFTVYDGDFNQYIEYFARVAGALFDKIFEHIEDRPPMPVHEHPEEFVKLIDKFNVTSAAGYFFSAYPQRIVKDPQS